MLADFLEVEPRYERVVEDFLRDELNYVVVKSWDAADDVVTFSHPYGTAIDFRDGVGVVRLSSTPSDH